ncbi:MAG: response regulator [Spirochaetaceae bacterium]|jgi:putative two-component system response regulator|nr:response regulator [Spirochaetaceae bacterium]
MGEIKKKTILGVDDMPEMLTNINAILKKDYDVRTAIDVQSALKILETTKIDLLLLDVEMPTLSGFDFFEKLQKDEALKDIPVVFITANADDETAQKAIKKGVQGYLTKPVSPAALLDAVAFFLD